MSHTLKFNPSSDMLKSEKLGYTEKDQSDHYIRVTYDFTPLWDQVLATPEIAEGASDEEVAAATQAAEEAQLKGRTAFEALCKRGLDIACSPYDIYSKLEAKEFRKIFSKLPKGEHPVSAKVDAKMPEATISVADGNAKSVMRSWFESVTGFKVPERAPAATSAEKTLAAVQGGKFSPAELELLARAIAAQKEAK